MKVTDLVKKNLFLLALGGVLAFPACTPEEPVDDDDPIVETYPVEAWITSPDQSSLFRARGLDFSPQEDDRFPVIEIDTAIEYQSVDGFGYTLTGGSALLINQLGQAGKAALLRELFSADSNAIGISYLRVSLGASDLSPSVFSYNDRPGGTPDPNLDHFSLSQDTIHLIPLLKEILAINPDIKIMASPWSAPVWMKNNSSTIGGSLQTQYYGVYAKYFVKYIQAMAAEGIAIDAVTVQNEPQHGGNNPSMVMSATEQANFVKNHLGPAFQSAGLSTKIIIWDHNCDNPGYPIAILDDPAAKPFIDGSAFHLYGGDISALSAVHNAHPDKNLYFTEQWTGANGSFSGDLEWHIRNVIIGSLRNWSRVALEWNLAADPSYDPHTPGGCSECKGALTISGASVISRNVSYYIVAHASKFIRPGSVRLASNYSNLLPNVAFKTPDGKKVLLVMNEDDAALKTFNISCNGKWIVASLGPGAVGTIVWE
jgi:glucosylceramidase